MTTLHRSTAAQNAPSVAGTIMSLVSALPDQHSALARRARAIADHGTPREAGDILAALLDATDCGVATYDADLLDEEFDA